MYWMATCVNFLIKLEKQRKKLQRAVGPSYQDSQWGVGQITTVMVWGPLIHEIVLEFMGNIIFPFRLDDANWP